MMHIRNFWDVLTCRTLASQRTDDILFAVFMAIMIAGVALIAIASALQGGRS